MSIVSFMCGNSSHQLFVAESVSILTPSKRTRAMIVPRTERRMSFVATTLYLGLITSVASRSIDPGELILDKDDVPARYVYEVDKDEAKNDIKKNQGYRDSTLAFDMPIAVAIFSAVMLLICCFCCLRCAVGYDGIKRSGFYYGSKTAKIVDTTKIAKPEKPIKQ